LSDDEALRALGPIHYPEITVRLGGLSFAASRWFAAEMPAFPANLWKPVLEPINIQGRGAKRDLTPATAGIKPQVLGSPQRAMFSLDTSDSQFLE
jgi:hypothetical protein